MNHDNCSLYVATNVTVPGEGPLPCRVMVVGEAPGREEVRVGKPFVGASGRILATLLRALDLTRDDVYITNVVKHLPPRKPPTPNRVEVEQCLSHLWDEIEAARPEVIITVGSLALNVFVGKAKITKEHGVARIVDGRVIVPWIHPAASLRPGGATYLPLMKADAEKFWREVERVQSTSSSGNDYRLDGDGSSILFDGGNGCCDRGGVVGFDTETTAPKRGKVFQTDEARVIGFSVSEGKGVGRYLPTPRRGSGDSVLDICGGQREGESGVCNVGVGDGQRASESVSWLATIAENPKVTKICHNVKFELKVLRNTFGVNLVNYHDTMLAAYLLGAQTLNLDDLAKQLLSMTLPSHKEVMHGAQMEELEPEEVARLACAHADATLQLWHVLQPRLVEEGLWKVYEGIELPLVPVLAKMEGHGVALDTEKAKALGKELEEAEAQARNAVATSLHMGDTFNPNSHEQLGLALVDRGVPIRKRTGKKRLPATDKDTLASLRDSAPDIIDSVLKMRAARKLKTYVDGWVTLVGEDGRLHTSLNQAAHYEEADMDAGGNVPAPPGRLSSSGPNLQNIPHHVDEVMGRRIRACIVPSKGNVLMAADVEQEEPRIIAYMANDDRLQNRFDLGLDIYRAPTEAIYPFTALPMGDSEWKKRFSHERYNGKTFVLAWWYGAEAARLQSIDPSLTTRVVKEGIRRLAEAHPARATYLDSVREDLLRDGYVMSLFGRKRWVPQAATGRVRDLAEAVRIGANARIQMTAGDVLKMAMFRVDREMVEVGLRSKMVLCIHDELIFDAVREEVPLLSGIVTRAFSDIVPFRLPLDIRVGKNWGEL
ncbi:MAG: hypothetical protein HY459_02835 [Parcubacteria group bacterium]|nr:hypothetical protein [Parcubacteria group bacterium]